MQRLTRVVREIARSYRGRVDWSPDAARQLACDLLRNNQERLSHVAGVARRAESTATRLGLSTEVVTAGWLHDIGYAEEAVVTGFHPLDGAHFLATRGAPRSVVSLVAYHSGAEFEAMERGLLDELSAISRPDRLSLDVLTYADMTTSSTGQSTTFDERLSGIFARYASEHPVHRAIQRGREQLRLAVSRISLVDTGAA